MLGWVGPVKKQRQERRCLTCKIMPKGTYIRMCRNPDKRKHEIGTADAMRCRGLGLAFAFVGVIRITVVAPLSRCPSLARALHARPHPSLYPSPSPLLPKSPLLPFSSSHTNLCINPPPPPPPPTPRVHTTLQRRPSSIAPKPPPAIHRRPRHHARLAGRRGARGPLQRQRGLRH